MPELYIGAVAIAPVIVALVALFRWIGLPGEYAPYANGALSVLFVVLSIYLGYNPDALVTVETVLNMLVAFLSAAGFYNIVVKNVLNR